VALAALAALLLGMRIELVGALSAMIVGALLLAAITDYVVSRRAWKRASATLTRRMSAAFALAVQRTINLVVAVEGELDWEVVLYDGVDPTLMTTNLPLRLKISSGKRVETSYQITPLRRGEVVFAAADVRVRSRWGLCELFEQLGTREVRRVYPDFAQVAQYAWLAGDRRLQEIGIKTYHQRGSGTDFRQLSEYRYGDPVRNIDWKATERHGKPIIREFQDERDQCILLLIDCGRRMRADDRAVSEGIPSGEGTPGGGRGDAHFDQVLNAVMLLSYVALQQGDAVGALTFGTPAGLERSFAPRKGTHALNALMSELYGLQPSPTHSDYGAAAQALLRKHRKRALVILITNFRDEDSAELGHALRLLRSQHLVMVASLRERIVQELMSQPLLSGEAALDVASAHQYEQSRRDAFNRLAARDALMVDAEPAHLGIELVNRYHSVKRRGLI
jgi:uncharacterized protein (DUF58 family)